MKSEFVLLILNCYKYREKAIKQKNTWLKNLPENVVYFHLIGDKEKCKDNGYLFDHQENVLYVNTKDDYNSLPSKVVSGLLAVDETYEYKYIFKTDDDQVLIQEEFFSKLPNYLLNHPKHNYGGFVVKVNDHISTYYTVHDCLPRDLFLEKCMYCNGRFYFLSNDAAKSLIEKKEEISNCIIEDHAIGLYLNKSFKKDILNFDTRNVFFDNT